MKILALECSAGPASSAIMENGVIIASEFTNVKMTHSQTLLPMVKSMLDKSGLSMKDIDAMAVSHGPGSFTGIRIGISAVKGLAAPKKLPCYAVSTLRTIAENYRNFDGIVCAVMDARCNQVYNALFKAGNGKLSRLFAVSQGYVRGRYVRAVGELVIAMKTKIIFFRLRKSNTKDLFQNIYGIERGQIRGSGSGIVHSSSINGRSDKRYRYG